ncbi:unnamed protein product [Lactuca virosa]|uniref:Malectin-like domain-containing protein n=1 Tax=Lactuca virosa TaxID=75947 RepID=A0AAU9MAQ0_9ASTR|nr:unnamed protein product [Lactuca virosa]
MRTRNSSLASMASALCFFLLTFLSSLSLISSQYVLPQRYFINCGSNSKINFTGRNFVGDVNPSEFFVSGGHIAVENNNTAINTPPIYRTARVFAKKLSYELEAEENNTFVMVRLHFSPFSSNEFQLSYSKVDVSVSGFSLLSKFSIGNMTVIREFIIPIGLDRRFTIEFTPSHGSSSAFVNAIEAFTTPSDLFKPGVSYPRISPAGKIDDLENFESAYAFNPIYRVNVGGQTIGVDLDTLRRTWTPDDSFIYSNEPAQKVTFNGSINYYLGVASSDDAPDDVYKTAKQLNNRFVNITWNFDVNENAMYLVRAHFCDIISRALINSNDDFNFFVYSHHKEEIRPVSRMQALKAPFYVDLVVEPDFSGLVNISIGAIPGSNQPVFLNGVEIMELLKKSGVPDLANIEKKVTSVFIMVVCVLAGLALLLLLLAGFFIGSRCGKLKQVVVGAKSESHVVPSYGRSSYTSINVDFTVNHPSPKLELNLRKSDVYSFGVVLLEVLCARPAFDHKLPLEEVNLADWAIKKLKNGNVEKIIDPFLKDTICPYSLRKFIEIVERCLKQTGDERPIMVDVLWYLEYVLKLQLMSVDKESYDGSTINTSLQLPMSIIDRLPSQLNDESNVDDNLVLSYVSESQVFSQLKLEEVQ